MRIKSGTFYRALGSSKPASPILLAGHTFREAFPNSCWPELINQKSAQHPAGTGVLDPCLLCVSCTTQGVKGDGEEPGLSGWCASVDVHTAADSARVHCTTGHAERVTHPVSRTLMGMEPLLSNAECDEEHRLGSLDSKPCAIPYQPGELGQETSSPWV
ncbi:unnamed protein product [Rangifer tarandus platyrhynchus]|uniref:Uncharacterized protein n=1 Tax=Rangifer tarandus platyrhynchus TaxID=3082113 RepID=A0AC59Y723_RANTA